MKKFSPRTNPSRNNCRTGLGTIENQKKQRRPIKGSQLRTTVKANTKEASGRNWGQPEEYSENRGGQRKELSTRLESTKKKIRLLKGENKGSLANRTSLGQAAHKGNLPPASDTKSKEAYGDRKDSKEQMRRGILSRMDQS
ncbi:hypothetical protein C922_02483 [Plasmodium inui San Antonio 1]|uniref:Uncharacterized protein n=1 Tax=Plasmodium inui San Antonio 1 TaxID=1237626 RepID=W7ACQ6_9APIC|nr:hypothetical protein C922_02483 [Plasmodium inui San Antonio 1]EUD66899.1 hypothetical protein C922_02483 [Plasmodium inui San Antonio 1]